MVFLFGLIHGFGLSTRLQTFALGLDQFFAKIVCFNVGVVLGQILTLIPILFIISKWKGKKGYSKFYKVANRFLIIAGILLFTLQLYGYFHEFYHHDGPGGHTH